MSKYPNEIHFPMDDQQLLEVERKIQELSLAGRDEEAEALTYTIPVLPEIAKIMKRDLGLDFLKEMGVNLYPAIEAFGEDWLES